MMGDDQVSDKGNNKRNERERGDINPFKDFLGNFQC
jgi:hypothetical protein